MKTPLSTLHLRRAESLDDALEILRDEPRTPIAGATDVYVALNFGTHGATRFLDIWGLDELRGIDVRDDMLVLGALVTWTDMIDSPAVHERLPMLVEAARQVGGPQIQNRGTVGGNVANGSPAGDSLPVLAATERALAAGASLDDAMTALRGEIRPIDDVRSTAEYRLRVTENLVRRFWTGTAG